MERAKGLYLTVILMILATALVQAAPAYAQAELIAAFPEPDAVLPASPNKVVLTFNRVLLTNGTTVHVLNEQGEQVDQRDVAVDPTNRFEVTVSLPTLPEGAYRVRYVASTLGASTIAVGEYQFTIKLPPPTLKLLNPPDGAAFEGEPVQLEMQVEFFDFGLYNNRIHLYIDDEFVEELRSLEYEVPDLEPGVHKLQVVLAQFDGEELPNTETVIYIAVANPDIEARGRELAAAAPTDPGLQLSTWQLIGVIVTTVVLLAFGIWLGYITRQRRDM